MLPWPVFPAPYIEVLKVVIFQYGISHLEVTFSYSIIAF